MYTNGRVALYNYGGELSGLLLPPSKSISQKATPYRDALTGGWDITELSCVFFSAQNIQNLHDDLRDGVRDRSNGQYNIGQQNEEELKTIMRSIYLQYSVNSDSDIVGQVKKLNALVLDYAIGQVYGEAVGYVKYLRDAGTLYSDGGALLPNPQAPDNLCKELEFGKRAI